MKMLKVDALPHGWQVLATILLTGSLTAIAYGVTKAGLAEIAAAFLSFWLVFVSRHLFAKIVASRAVKHFAESKKILEVFASEVSAWILDRQLLAICLLGVPVSFAFVCLKAFLAFALGAFGSVYFAVGFGLLFASVVCSPLLFKSMREVILADSSENSVSDSVDTAPLDLGK